MNQKKTKLAVTFERVGDTNTNIAELVSAHNEGITLFFIKEVLAAIKMQQVKMPYVLKNLRLELIEDEGKLNVYENGKDLTYTVQENEYYTLNEEGEQVGTAGEDALLIIQKN